MKKKVYKNKQSISIASGLREGYAGDIDPTYIDSIVDTHNNCELSILRPYRSVDNVITKVSTDDIYDYYIVPKNISMAKANHSNTHIYTVTPYQSDRKYYCYVTDHTYIITSNYDDLIKLVNYDYATAIIGLLLSWEATNKDLLSYFKKDFEKIYKDLEPYANIVLPNHIRISYRVFARYWVVVEDNIIHHTQGPVIRPQTKVVHIDNIDYLSRSHKSFIQSYICIPPIITDSLKIKNITITKIDDDIEYRWSTSKGMHIIVAKTKEDLFLKVNKFINDKIQSLLEKL